MLKVWRSSPASILIQMSEMFGDFGVKATLPAAQRVTSWCAPLPPRYRPGTWRRKASRDTSDGTGGVILRGKTDRLVATLYPQLHFPVASALRVGIRRKRMECADLHGNDDAASAVTRLRSGFAPVAFERTVIAFFAPVGEKILEGIAAALVRLPDLVRELKVSGGHRVHEVVDSVFFAHKSQRTPGPEPKNQQEGDGAHRIAQPFRLRFFGCFFQQTDQLRSRVSTVGAVAAPLKLPLERHHARADRQRKEP